MVRRLLLIVGAVFAPVGILLLIVCAIITMAAVQYREAAVSTTGTIVDLRTGQSCSGNSCSLIYYPVVTFRTADGRQITFASNSGSSLQPQVGKHVRVLYQRNDPAHARLDSFVAFWVGPLVAGILGIVFTLVGSILIIVWLRLRRLDSWLDSNGTRITATLRHIGQDPNVTINGIHPWQLIAVWTDPATGQHHTFRSADLTNDPSRLLNPGQAIEVLIDPADPDRRHEINLRSLGITI